MSNLAKGSAKGFANAAKYLANAKLQLELLSKTTNLAADCSRFFDPNMNRHLFTHGPPRPPCPLSIDSAISFRKRTLEDLEQVLKANECTSLLSAIQHARFFGLRLPTPNILTRSLFIHNLASETRLLGRIDLSKLAQDGAQAFAASPYPTASKEAKSILAKFAKRCELPIMYLLRSMLYNRPRQRRMLQKSVLEWEQLQSEAEEMDMALQELVPGVSKVGHSSYRTNVDIVRNRSPRDE